MLDQLVADGWLDVGAAVRLRCGTRSMAGFKWSPPKVTLQTVNGRIAATRCIFSICNALCQGGLLTLPDVPPSVCYLSGRRRQRRGPKPGGQRNLDPRIGRERASRHGDCQHHGGRGPAVRGMVKLTEVLLKAVTVNKPKMLTGLNQKVRGQAQGLSSPLSRTSHHRPTSTT